MLVHLKGSKIKVTHRKKHLGSLSDRIPFGRLFNGSLPARG